MRNINKRIVGGVLSIISGAVFLIAGAMILGAESGAEGEGIPLIGLIFALIFLLIGGVLPVIGGIFAIKRKQWTLALAGGIGAIVGFVFTGIPALILIMTSKNDFE
jgi:hypothetical protein